MNESQTKMTDLETDKEKYMSYLYFASIAVEKDHRDIKTATKLFLKCRSALKKLTNSNVKIKEVMADCSTNEGREIAERILHLKPYKKTLTAPKFLFQTDSLLLKISNCEKCFS